MPNIVTVHPDGTGTAVIDGSPPATVSTATPEETRHALLELILNHAKQLGHPVEVTARDGEEEGVNLLVHPDGAITTAPRTTAPTSMPPRRSFLDEQAPEEPARQGWRGLLTSLGLRVSPGPAERAERADIQAVSQHWPGPRTIAVVNGKGGASKTPTTILLSAVLARYGGAGVLAWDNNQTRGTLGWRTEKGPHDATVLDLLPHTDRLLGTGAQAADLAHYVHHQTGDRYDVLRSQPLELASTQRVSAKERSEIEGVLAVIEEHRQQPSDRRFIELPLSVSSGNILLYGHIDSLFGEEEQRIVWRAGRNTEAYLIENWLYYLVQIASQNNVTPPLCYAIEDKGPESYSFKTVDKTTALELLRHYVEAYLVKNGICYGKSKPFEVNIIDGLTFEWFNTKKLGG